MKYAALVTFDLKNASSADYTAVYAELAKRGLHRVQKADNGTQHVIPTTTVMGEIEAATSGDAAVLALKRTQAAILTRNLRSEVFAFAANDWAWRAAAT